jgi:hypothetical protein
MRQAKQEESRREKGRKQSRRGNNNREGWWKLHTDYKREKKRSIYDYHCDVKDQQNVYSCGNDHFKIFPLFS